MGGYGGIAVFSFLIGLSGALIPGPMMLATVTSSRKHGYVAGPLISAAHAVQELIMVVALVFGASRLLVNDHLIGGVSFAGAAVLAWMGIAAIRYSRSASLQGAMERPASKFILNPILAGITTTAGNPMWWVWWPTVGFAYMAMVKDIGLLAIVPFYFGHVFADFLVYSGISTVVTAGGRWLRDRHFRFVIAACGAFLIGFACFFAAFGVRKIVWGEG